MPPYSNESITIFLTLYSIVNVYLPNKLEWAENILSLTLWQEPGQL
jgi:hypothetical protein